MSEPTASASPFSMTHALDAPPALVWSVWTEPEHVMQWWGPHGFTVPVYEAELRTGGKMYYAMRAPDGTLYPSDGTFEEVAPHERIVTTGAVEIGGNVAFDARTVVAFEERGGKTVVRVTQTYTNVTPAGASAIAGAPAGWSQQFEKLEAYLRGLATA